MQAEKQQAWKISVQAKAKNFHFKLKATQIAPSTWKLHRLSISLKLLKLFLRVNAESTAHQKAKKNSELTSLLVPMQQQKQTLKSKFLIFVKKFRFRSTKKRDKPRRFSYERVIWSMDVLHFYLNQSPEFGHLAASNGCCRICQSSSA